MALNATAPTGIHPAQASLERHNAIDSGCCRLQAGGVQHADHASCLFHCVAANFVRANKLPQHLGSTITKSMYEVPSAILSASRTINDVYCDVIQDWLGKVGIAGGCSRLIKIQDRSARTGNPYATEDIRILQQCAKGLGGVVLAKSVAIPLADVPSNEGTSSPTRIFDAEAYRYRLYNML